MVDIVIPPIHRMDRFNRNRKNPKKSVFRGKIVSVRRARYKIDPKKPRKKDGENSKAFIIIVRHDVKEEDLINKTVEIKII